MLNAATAAFAGLGLIWGSNFIFMKWASDTLSAGHITFLRVLFGFVPVLYALLRGALSRTHLRYAHDFAVMSLLATSVYYFAFARGTSLLPSGIAVALSGAIPIVSFVAAAALLRGEPVTAVSALGVAVGFGGVLLIARPWSATGHIDGGGVVAMLVGSASVGLSFVYARRFLGGPAGRRIADRLAVGRRADRRARPRGHGPDPERGRLVAGPTREAKPEPQ